MKSIAWRGSLVSLITLAVIATGAALADPASQTKTHTRKKHEPYIGYTGHQWDRDFGVMKGTCNRKSIGRVLAKAKKSASAAAAKSESQASDDANRDVSIMVGNVLGSIIAREISRKFDERDRACFGHSLELAPEGQGVKWTNEKTGVTFLLEPHGQAQSGGTCRTYKLTASKAGKTQSDEARACRNEDGTWKKV